MRKFISFLLIVLTMLLITSCNRSAELEMYLSQIRNSIYTYESEDFTITVYGEEKETPFISDGFVSELKKFITVKIENFTTSPDEASVTVTFNEISLNGKFEYNPINGKYTAVIETNVLPTSNEIDLLIKNSGSERKIVAKNICNENVIDYKKALKSVSAKSGGKIDKMLDKAGNSIEIRVRILVEGKRPYYYVSAVEKSGKTLAFLVDGLNGEVLAEREFN